MSMQFLYWLPRYFYREILMNKIFKIKRNALGQSIVTSELAKSRGKTVSLATALVASLLSIGTAVATPSTIGQGNLVTGEKGVTDGYNNTVTAIKGTAQGNDSIATGNNLSRDEFSAKLNEHNALLSDKTTKEGEVGTLSTNIEANNQAQTNLNNQIQDLNKIIDRAAEKSGQLDNLNNQLASKQNELTPLIEALERAKQNAASPSSTGTGDKTIWTDFTAQLGKLDWNKLSDSSNGTSGVNKLATDLKSMIESDYPDYTNQWGMDKYEEVINGYINRQGLFDSNEDAIGKDISKDANYVGFLYKAGGVDSNTVESRGKKYKLAGWLNNNILDYDEALNRRKQSERSQGLPSIPNALESLSKVSSDDININDIISYTAEQYNDSNGFKFSMLNLKNIINSDNAISKASKMYNSDYVSVGRSVFVGKQVVGDARIDKIKSLLELPPVLEGNKASVKFMYENDLETFITTTFANELGAVDNGLVSDKNAKAFISNTDVDYLRKWLGLFYDDFNNKIDLNASDDKWLFDKDNFTEQFTKVEGFAHKLRNYVEAYDAAIANPNDTNAQIKLVTLYNEIREQRDNPENYYENINVQLKQSVLDIWNQQAEKTAEQLTDYALKLKLYDARNEVIKGVITAAQDLKNGIDDAQKAIDAKQKEIDGINQQIKDLALTPDEQGAADLRRKKEQELADKQAEKTQLEQDKSAKQAELDEINRKLNETGLANLGKNSTALGANAFASGDDSIAIGTNSTAQNENAIAIGHNATTLNSNSIAIGYNLTNNSDDSVLMGAESTVTNSGTSVTIGDNNNVSDSKYSNVVGYDNVVKNAIHAISIGSNVIEDTVMSNVIGSGNQVHSNFVSVLGNNVSIAAGFDGAVVLGNGSTVSAANPTASYEIKGTTYNFAGSNPTSVVSVGANGQERQITNVAAGRIAESSTDAINGSQLYALAAAIAQKTVTPADVSDEVTNQLETKLVGGDNITIDKDDATNTFTITGKNTQSVVVAGQGVSVGAQDNAIGTKDYTVSAKLGEGLVFDDNGAIKANGTKITAGENVEVTGDATNGYTITAKTQIINGGKATVVHAGDNVQVTGDVDNGFTVSVENMRTTVTGGDGAEVTPSDNADGSKNYTVKVKAGDGLTYDDNGNVVNDLKLTAGDNVQVTGDAKTGYTVSATDTNTQSTVTAGQGITVKAADNAIGTKDYTVETKLGKGLKIDENGAIAATAQPINGGNGVTVTTNDQDESVVDVVGVTTTTDDGKSYTRSDLTKAVGVKGDGKNIRTTTATNGDVQVQMNDNIQVNSVTVHNGPTINQNGINANNTRVTNVQDGVAPTDAVNVRQLNEHSSQVNNRINQVEGNLRKQNKMRKAGHASALATAGLMQAHREGQSGVTAAVGQYQGQTAVAVGYSRLSDNGKYGVKLSLNANTQKEVGGTVGVGYFW